MGDARINVTDNIVSANALEVLRDTDDGYLASLGEVLGKNEVFSYEHVDPVLSQKMKLVNNVCPWGCDGCEARKRLKLLAIDDIGFTPYHWKLFMLNGFGYAVDSLLTLIQALIQPQVAKEMNPSFPRGLTIAVYCGLLLGALFWGLTADMVGRRWAFNTSLLICSIFAIIAGWAGSYPVLGFLVAMSAFGGGGNLILDTTVFLEFLPSSKQWLLTLLAAWWGVGQTIAGLVAWPLLGNFSCETSVGCTRENNMGWRYVWWTLGGLVFLMSIARVVIVRLEETPKYLLSKGKDEEVVTLLTSLAEKYGRLCSLTIATLKECGEVKMVREERERASRQREGYCREVRKGWRQLKGHFRGLFLDRTMGITTGLIWLSWALIGLAYPLYYVFLPEYLASRGAKFGDGSVNKTYQDYAISNTIGIFGPILAGFLCEVKYCGRRGTMVIGALATMVFLFAYTQVRNEDQNLALTCMVYFWLNTYYGTLYAYTPEVLPSAHRATGNGVAVAFNRVMGILSALVATYADTKTSAPIFICAALFAVMAGVALVMPLEPYGRRSA
ncbi:membrane transporter [Tirmania nivea]|nr:membrane transporter [Tirmania nivea]